MLLKVLFLLIILYFVLRTVRSLVRAISADGAGRVRSELNQQPPHNGWRGPASGNQGAEEDVEDAKWVDL